MLCLLEQLIRLSSYFIQQTMSYFATYGSVRAISKLFENIQTPVFCTHVGLESGAECEPELLLQSETKPDFVEDSVENVEDSKAIDSSIILGNNSETGNSDEIKIAKSITAAAKEMKTELFEGHKIPQETNVQKHLKEYPIVSSWIKIFHLFLAPKVVRSSFMRIAYSDSIAPYTVVIDNFLDARLNSVDALVPGIRTLRMRDIRNIILDDPIKTITAKTSKSLIDIGDKSQKLFLGPSRHTIHQLRSLRGEYLPAFGNQPLIRGQINLLFKQLNEQIASDISKYLLIAEKSIENGENRTLPINYVYLDDGSNEISHVIQLINTTILRLRPLLYERLKQLNQSPSKVAKYVSATYQDSKTNRGDGRMVIILASLETIRKLSLKGCEFVSPAKFFLFLQSHPNPVEKLSIVEETESIEFKEIIESAEKPQVLN